LSHVHARSRVSAFDRQAVGRQCVVSDKHRIPIRGTAPYAPRLEDLFMTPASKHDDPSQCAREEHAPRESEPRPWTAPDFVERSTCAEIGAYAFQDK
jgi:hypothetical protein